MLPAGPTRKSDPNYPETHVRSTTPFSLPLAFYQAGFCICAEQADTTNPKGKWQEGCSLPGTHTGVKFPISSACSDSGVLTFTSVWANVKSQDGRENCSARRCSLMFCVHLRSRFWPGCTASISAASQQAASLWLSFHV